MHGVGAHTRTGGVCLVMQCHDIANDSTSNVVGVTVGLVSVYVIETTRALLNKKAKAFLSKSLDDYAQDGELNHLYSPECKVFFIENELWQDILKGLINTH